MPSLLDASTSVPAVAYGAEPFNAVEIDVHPDCARIWATVRAMRAEYEAACDDYDARLKRAGDVS